MSSLDVKLTITPYTPSTLPPEHALVASGKALLATLDTWKQGKTFGDSGGRTPYKVKTLSHPKAPGDGAAWHARVSEHTASEGSFDDFWDGLGRDKAIKEQEFIREISKVTLLRSISPTQKLWTLQYKFTPPVSPRVFTVLQVTHLAGGDDGSPREGWIISVPVDVTEDSQLKAQEEKGVRGRYVSVERIMEADGGKLVWTMATSSTPGGSIPQFVAERTMPGTISKDVLHFLEWISKHKPVVSPTAPTLPPVSPVASTYPEKRSVQETESTQPVRSKKPEPSEPNIHTESSSHEPSAPAPTVSAAPDDSSPAGE